MNEIFHQPSSEPYLSFLTKVLHGTSVVIVGNIDNVHQNIINTENALIYIYLNNSLNGVFGTYYDSPPYSNNSSVSLCGA